ncbi:MAG TPA: VOC family protein [Thermoanaerobaculia bacterium]|jgi:hypothetical protein|nr:VOC family protein [Thermoanaerobaculia bacterium]
MIKKVTPILIVNEIEPSLRLWVDRLGFQKVVEVPEGDRLGFVILAGEGIELMYQTRESVENEVKHDGLPATMKPAPGRSVLYIDVADLGELREKVAGFEVILPDRKTSYGARELWLVEPGGHLVAFAVSQQG